MSTTQHPSDPPPAYEDATAPAPAQNIRRVSTDGPGRRTTRNGIPPEYRRSMEDEHRALPTGWVRQFDPVEQHQFFVDTNANPPRSIWVHPYDDPEFLATLSPEERTQHSRLHRSMTLEDLAAEDTDGEDDPRDTKRKHTAVPGGVGAASSSSNAESEPHGLHKFGRKMKDKVTGSTHVGRERDRQLRAEQEQRAYAMHMQARQAMVRALETGQPQFLCKDQRGRDVYIEPPPMRGRGYGGYSGGAYGYNPYVTGMYGSPNARFVRPAGPYGRPYGYGYGGGIGAPVAAGLLGGTLLGGLLF